ncbi:MAG TPA: lysophospholipid acyltransferase family protein [Tepidisphaeraceae bacterium]|nr:lysophospholipid acyltransferase family protein [Tepidisphaeraceae bacterium]
MAKRRIAWIDWLQYIALRVVSMFLHCWPVNANLQTAKLLGDLMYRIDRKHRQRAIANLTRSFPELSSQQIERLAQRSMQTLFMFFVEVLFTTRLIHINTWRRYVELDRFEPVLDMLLRKKQPVLLLTGHYGNFEISNYILGTFGFETTAIGRPLDNPYVNEWMMGVRQRQGSKIINKKGATDEVTGILEQNGVVGFVADQNAGSKGVFVDFFGRKASTYKSIGLLAMQYNTPIVIGYSRRLGDQFRFKVGAQDIIYPQDWQDQTDPLRYITQRYTKAIEDIIRQDPGQYWWVHRRWKTRPKGEAPEAYD